jgi:hypothetical protein
MDKQEVIKQAYGDHWDKVCEYVDDKGWCHGFFGIQMQELQGIGKPKNEPTKWRPKSLEGLEDNNGWIKIESEEDLPKEIEGYWHVVLKGKVIIIELLKDDKSKLFQSLKKDEITHYKLIEKPKPPIY